MKKETKKSFYIAVGMLVAFLLWTVAVRFVDVKAIGPNDSSVGFATVNEFFHNNRLAGISTRFCLLWVWVAWADTMD